MLRRSIWIARPFYGVGYPVGRVRLVDTLMSNSVGLVDDAIPAADNVRGGSGDGNARVGCSDDAWAAVAEWVSAAVVEPEAVEVLASAMGLVAAVVLVTG